jgi:iron complex outermembrane recepter protein
MGAAAATLSGKVAGVDITSVTGYNRNTLFSWGDVSGFTPDSQLANQLFPGSFGAPQENYYHTEKFSQEIRLASSPTKWLDWLAGAFYTHETSPGTSQVFYAANLATGATTGVMETSQYYPLTLSEEAIFADLTFHLTDRFDLQLGGRQAWNRIFYESQYYGPGVQDIFGVPSPDVQPTGRASGNPFTYLVTPKFEISRHLQIYARLATGYRIGGPNFLVGNEAQEGIPLDYKPDRSINYEIGVKGDAFEHHLHFDVAAYYINWTDLQLNVSVPTNGNYFASYTTNAGGAKSEGVELQVEAHPLEDLTLGIQGSFDNAVLTQDMPPGALNAGTYGLAGFRLPWSIRTSGGFTVNQDVHLSDGWVGFAGGAFNYVGPRPTLFASAPPPTERVWMPGYTQLNLRTGVRDEAWLVNLYVNNVTDRRGVVGYNNWPFNLGNPGAITTVIQPRTIGVGVARNF